MSNLSEITRLESAKADIKAYIESRGITVPDSSLLDDYRALLDEIPQGTELDLNGDNFDYLMTKGEHRMKLFPYVDLANCDSFTYFMNECKLDENGNKITNLDLRNLKLEGAKISNGNYAFNAMTNCTELILPESEWNVRSQNYMFAAFAGTKITNIEFLNDDTNVGSTTDHRNEFRNCPKLEEADLSGMTAKVCTQNYWQNAFYQCYKIRKVWIPSTCINIGATTYAYSPFNNSNKDCVVFTDAPSQPATWTGTWDNFNATVKIEVRYAATHDEYEAY